MPLHDWTRASPGMFPDFHSSWLTDLKRALNRGLLPPGYYAMAEQRTGIYGPDVLTLTGRPRPAPVAEGNGVAEAEPRTARRFASHGLPAAGRAVTIRHAGGDRVVAVIEVVSPANKDRPEHVGDFAGKVAGLVRSGIHLVVVDILPPGHHDPYGMHAAIWPGLDTDPEPAAPPADRPYTFAGYRADDRPVAFVEYAAVGQPLPPVPLYLDGPAFVNVPLEETYMTNYAELPAELRAGLG
ncbi:MAG: DUF4058 family protein [Gemmataceae bacterium]|nr:DUF4058 family protein [Gemmataceae bacterium]